MIKVYPPLTAGLGSPRDREWCRHATTQGLPYAVARAEQKNHSELIAGVVSLDDLSGERIFRFPLASGCLQASRADTRVLPYADIIRFSVSERLWGERGGALGFRCAAAKTLRFAQQSEDKCGKAAFARAPPPPPRYRHKKYPCEARISSVAASWDDTRVVPYTVFIFTHKNTRRTKNSTCIYHQSICMLFNKSSCNIGVVCNNIVTAVLYHFFNNGR